ncbi:hypothetical protein BDQ17DRAFT_1352239 [Cyathus striatus]|nr:hypothetical protein BDQ17DRAFT_1352239 [Cyathus striatus]
MIIWDNSGGKHLNIPPSSYDVASPNSESTQLNASINLLRVSVASTPFNPNKKRAHKGAPASAFMPSLPPFSCLPATHECRTTIKHHQRPSRTRCTFHSHLRGPDNFTPPSHLLALPPPHPHHHHHYHYHHLKNKTNESAPAIEAQHACGVRLAFHSAHWC